jgi:hypothetical protein
VLKNLIVTKEKISCHPPCVWECDVPQCVAECKAVVEPLSCICENSDAVPTCRVECQSNVCELDQCPVCESFCEPLEGCVYACPPPVANWACRKPSQCPPPTCVLQCENPFASCIYEGPDPWVQTTPTGTTTNMAWSLLVICLVLAVLVSSSE